MEAVSSNGLMIRSAGEKFVLCQLVKESPLLDFPLLKRERRPAEPEGYVMDPVYIIPDDKRAALYPALVPFVEVPEMDAPLYDLHSKKLTSLRKCQVIRYKERNLLVSEFYYATGGMLVDLIDPRNAPNEEGGDKGAVVVLDEKTVRAECLKY